MSKKNLPKAQSITLEAIEEVKNLLPEAILRDKIRAGEYTALAECEAFLQRSDEGKLMALVEAMGCRKRQLEGLLPALCNQSSHDTYIEVLNEIKRLEKMMYEFPKSFYKHRRLRQIPSEAKGKSMF